MVCPHPPEPPADETPQQIRDAILGVPVKIRELYVTDWGRKIHVREITSGQRDLYEQRVGGDRTTAGESPVVRAMLVCFAVCDQSGTRVFSDADIPAVAAMPQGGVDQVFWIAKELGGLNPEAVEDAEKNSEGTPVSDSGTD